MCAEAKHSAERSPWHCCKNKRIANGAYPPRPRRLRFIYDTSEPSPTLLLFLLHPPSKKTLHLVSFLKIKQNLNSEYRIEFIIIKFLFLYSPFTLFFPLLSHLSLPFFLKRKRGRVKKEKKNCEGRVVKKKIVIWSGTILLRGILERLLKKQFLPPPCVFYGSLTLMRNRPPTATEQILLSVVKSDLKMQQ